MPLDFPNNPAVGQIFGAAGVSWNWDGVKWVSVTNSPGPFLPLSGGTMGGPLNLYATGGTVARSEQDRAADVANVLDFGADPTGVADSSGAFNAAASQISPGGHNRAVYAPAGTYRINNQITLQNAQVLFGAGRGSTILTVDQAFNPSALAVILLGGGTNDTGPTVRDLGINFAQPTTIASRASMKTLANGGTSGAGGSGVMYPPAIMDSQAQSGSGRMQAYALRIAGAWDGIRILQTTFVLNDIEMGALNIGIDVGNTTHGILDFCHMVSYHFWCFGLNFGTTYSAVFADGQTTALSVGDVGGDFNGVTSFVGNVVVTTFATSSAPGGFIHFTNLQLDTNAALAVHGSNWTKVSNMYSTWNTNGKQPCISVTGGRVFISNYVGWTTSSYPNIQVTGGSLNMVNAAVFQYSPSQSAIVASGGSTRISSSSVYAGNLNSTYTQPLVVQSGNGILQLNNMTISGAGTATGTAVAYGSDNLFNSMSRITLGTGFTIAPVVFSNFPNIFGNYGDVLQGLQDPYSMQSGSWSFLGFEATAHYSTSYGRYALWNATDNSVDNTAFGCRAGQSNANGDDNTYIGALSGFGAGVVSDNSKNTTLGSLTAYNITTGSNNTLIGYRCGLNLTTGSGNLYVAAGTNGGFVGSAAESHTFRLGDNTAVNLMRATEIDTTTPKFFLDWLPGSATYANDAAAATGGVTVGQLYRNGSAVQVRVA
jgi:Pectate lyase superfamily protein